MSFSLACSFMLTARTSKQCPEATSSHQLMTFSCLIRPKGSHPGWGGGRSAAFEASAGAPEGDASNCPSSDLSGSGVAEGGASACWSKALSPDAGGASSPELDGPSCLPVICTSRNGPCISRWHSGLHSAVLLLRGPLYNGCSFVKSTRKLIQESWFLWQVSAIHNSRLHALAMCSAEVSERCATSA